MKEFSMDLLADSVSELRRRIDGKRAEMAALQEQLQRDERELHLFVEIIRLRGGSVDGSDVEELGDGSAVNGSVGTITSASGSLGETVLGILRQSGQPMHIQDLVAAVRDRGVPIPGRGEAANLIAHIRTHPEIVRPVRGMYGLRAWGLTDKPAPARRTRKRAVRRSAAKVRRPARATRAAKES